MEPPPCAGSKRAAPPQAETWEPREAKRARAAAAAAAGPSTPAPGPPTAGAYGVPLPTAADGAAPPVVPGGRRPRSAPCGGGGGGGAADEEDEGAAWVARHVPELRMCLDGAVCSAMGALNALLERNAHRMGEAALLASATLPRQPREELALRLGEAGAMGPAASSALNAVLHHSLQMCPEAALTAHTLGAPVFLLEWCRRHGVDPQGVRIAAVQGFAGLVASRPLFVPLL